MKNDNININTDPVFPIGNDQNTVYNRRIEYATTTTVLNNRFTTKSTLDIRLEKPNSVTNSSKVLRNIFEEIKNMTNSTTIITHDDIRIINSNTSSPSLTKYYTT